MRHREPPVFFTSIPEPRKLLVTVLAIANLGGCIGFDAISNEARPGGTVMVAMDAVRHHMPDPARVQATFFDHTGSEHSVSVRHVLRVQPDPLSAFGIGAVASAKGIYAGQKLAIVDLLDPATRLAPQMAVGEGVLELYMPDLERSSVHALTILPADALPQPPSNAFRTIQNPADIRPLHTGWLEEAITLPNVRLQTRVGDVYDPSVTIGGALFTLRFRKLDFIATPGMPGFSLTKLSSDPNLQLSWQTRDTADAETGEVVITLRNPHGFTRAGKAVYSADLQSLFEDLSSVAVGWLATRYRGTGAIPFDWARPPLFFDVHGNVVEGLSASLVSNSGF